MKNKSHQWTEQMKMSQIWTVLLDRELDYWCGKWTADDITRDQQQVASHCERRWDFLANLYHYLSELSELHRVNRSCMSVSLNTVSFNLHELNIYSWHYFSWLCFQLDHKWYNLKNQWNLLSSNAHGLKSRNQF